MKVLLSPIYHPERGRIAVALLIIRLVVGIAFMMHGYPKIQHAFHWMGDASPIPGFLQALAAFAEFGGGFSLILGLLTPLAALGILANMTVALLMVHLPAHQPMVAPPSQPSFELPLTYWAIMLLMLLAGPGVYSVDALLFGHRRGEAPTLKPSYR